MRKTLISGTLALVLTLSAAVKVPPSKTPAVPNYGNSEAITEHELKVYEYTLASDQMEGRNLPSRGFDTAALFIASQLAQWGLKPGGSAAKTNGPLQPFFMPFELVSRQILADESKVSVTAPAPQGGRGGRGGPPPAAGVVPTSAAPTPAEPRKTDYEYGKDWTIAAGGRGAPPMEAFELSGNLVFVGNGYVVNKTKTNPYENLDVKGKILVVAGLPAELAAQAADGGRGGRAGGGQATDAPATPAANPNAAPTPGAANTNPLGEPCTDFLTPEQAGAKNGALAVITIATFQQLTQMSGVAPAGPAAQFSFGPAIAGRPTGPNGPAFQVSKFKPALACPVVPSITAGLALATGLFSAERTRTAAQVFYAAGGNTKQDSFEFNDKTKVNLKLSLKLEAGHAENVVGTIEGADPVKKNEYVVISAHLDHIGIAAAAAAGGRTINAGADDDGSGSSALLAIARVYSEGLAKGMRPARSIIFLWNAGEEKGLWGSQYFAQFPPVELSKIVANINVDMVGRTKGANHSDPDATHILVNPGEIMVVGPNISSDELGKTMETVNDGYQKLKLNHFYDTTKPDKDHDNLGPQPNGQRIFYRSDHYNFAKMGIPIVFFTDGLHTDYHRPTDTPEKIDYTQLLKVTKTVSAITWVLANQEGKPRLNEVLPDQLKKDMRIVKEQGWGLLTPVLDPLPGEPI